MLTPDMILEDIQRGIGLVLKGNYFHAYKLFCQAETAYDREEEVYDLIGRPKAFIRARNKAKMYRMNAWKHLTDEEKKEAANLLDG